MATTLANQGYSNVGGDQAGRDIHKHVHNEARPVSQVTRLLTKLSEQIAANDESSQFVEALQFYVDDRASHQTVGLKEKLDRVGRGDEYIGAIRKKEAFAKLLLTFEKFSSAQELFAYLLAHVHDVFDSTIIPNCDELTPAEINEIVDEQIIAKILAEIGEGSDAFTLNRLHIRGMIFWLADRCYVRWHK